MPYMATDAERVNLVMPVITWPDDHTPIAVHWKSPKAHRRAVWKIAQFFRREFDYDFTQYAAEGREEDKDHVAYLWCPPDCVRADWRVHCIGATCFRKREEGRMAMQWIWLHPYWRRNGLLTNAWPGFVQRHGDFDVEWPVSPAMEAFLQKVSPCLLPRDDSATTTGDHASLPAGR